MFRIRGFGLLLLIVAVVIGSLPRATADESPSAKESLFTTGGSLKAAPPENGTAGLFVLKGAAVEGELGNAQREPAGRGIRFQSALAEKGGTAPTGSVTWMVNGVTKENRWFRARLRALAEENFRVEKDDLFVRVDFFKDGGQNALDQVTKSLYEQVERDRKNLADKGTNPKLGGATWRNYTFNFHTPFPEVDSLKLTIGFANGAGDAKHSEFWIREVEITPIPDPADYVPPRNAAASAAPPALSTLVKLGGRWYFDPRGGSKEPPKEFDHTTADRLYYLADRLDAPFAGNMTAWLRKGYQDREGKIVENDRLVNDNVLVSFTEQYLVMKSKNLPNHPTATFPDRWRLLDGNPNYIQEQQFTWYIPLEPKENPNHVAMDAENSNRALPGGAIGVAVNGIILHNPFDEHVRQDAVWRLDRCCGHPSPLQSYHYHKYPVCLNTPWADEGQGHSPLIGFAFDGFPVYGPYEAAGELAKDSKSNPLNEFNLHEDAARGPHYHVTPGKYPHLIGGFWGELEMKNRTRRGPPPGRLPPPRP